MQQRVPPFKQVVQIVQLLKNHSYSTSSSTLSPSSHEIEMFFLLPTTGTSHGSVCLFDTQTQEEHNLQFVSQQSTPLPRNSPIDAQHSSSHSSCHSLVCMNLRRRPENLKSLMLIFGFEMEMEIQENSPTYLPSRAVLESLLLLRAVEHRKHLCSVLVPSGAGAPPVRGDTSRDVVRMDCTLDDDSPSIHPVPGGGTLSCCLAQRLSQALDTAAAAAAVAVFRAGADGDALQRVADPVALPAPAAAAVELVAACSRVHSMVCNISAARTANCGAALAPR